MFREPRLESGYPDLVIVVWNEEIAFNWRPERQQLSICDMRLMHYLYKKRKTSKNELVGLFGRYATLSVKRLCDAGMIRCHGSFYTPFSLQKSFAALKIIAIEAKIGKWAEVLNQAVLNTWFASKSYVLVPKMPGISQLKEARSLGIGVCVRNDREVKEVASKSNLLPRSYASWMLNDLAWRSSQ